MEDKTNELLRAFNRIDKELDDVYHEVALRMNISDSAFTIFYIIHELGDGCLQKDICREAFANKQTVHSSIQKLEREGYLYLQQGDVYKRQTPSVAETAPISPAFDMPTKVAILIANGPGVDSLKMCIRDRSRMERLIRSSL